MNIMTGKHDRRAFLRGAGSVIALPALESVGYSKRKSKDKGAKPPKRIVFIGFGFGVTQESWYPDIHETGLNYKLSKGLKPLERHKSDFSIIQGCSNRFSEEAHWGSTFWLTGANRYAVGGKAFSNTISADQVVAKEFGKHTRFASIQFSGEMKSSTGGHGPGQSLAWDKDGRPLSGFSSALEAYHQVFSADKLPLSERYKAISEKRSVLDVVCEQCKRMKLSLSSHDRVKLDEYLQSIRDIENKLSRDEAWLSIPKTKTTLEPPRPGLSGTDEINMVYDLMAAVLQADSTRVMSYRQPVNSLLRSLGVKVNGHSMSHYSPGPSLEASELRDESQSQMFSRFLDNLKKIREVDGSRLFDNTVVVFGSNIRSIHYLDNCPTIIAGGGAGLKLGEQIVVEKDTPLCNVWLSIIHGLGLKVDSHGDSTGLIKELFTHA